MSGLGNTTKEKIDELFGFYHSQGYLYKNSGSILVTVVLFVVFFLINSYLFININTKYYKKNWTAFRCDPAVMPFAGLINAPPGEDKFDYTFKNFSFCLNKLLDDIVSFIMAPITFLIEIVILVYTAITLMIDEIVRMIDTVRTAIISIVLSILGVIMNFLIPFQKIILKAKVIMKKVHATNVTAMFTFLGTYMAMMSGILVAYEMLITFAFVLAAIIVVVWAVWLAFLGLNPVPAAIAVSLTVVLVVLLSLIIRIVVFTKDILGADAPSGLPGIPSKPHLCFGPHTPINIVGHGLIPISKVKTGMVINDVKQSRVTSVLKLTTSGQKIYKILDKETGFYLFVTGEHRIRAKIDGSYKWVAMKQHPDAVLVDDFAESHLYCLNTDYKVINVGEHWFKDWDDLHKKDYAKLQVAANKMSNITNTNTINTINTNVTTKMIHPLFENGFHSSSPISLKNGMKIPIKHVKPGDVLANGAKVYGIVNIMNTFKLGRFEDGVICTYNCYVRNNNGNAVPINIYSRKKDIYDNIKYDYKTDEPEDLWHLVTDIGRISCGNMEILDYNYNIDIHL